jgi:hypothetical protein
MGAAGGAGVALDAAGSRRGVHEAVHAAISVLQLSRRRIWEDMGEFNPQSQPDFGINLHPKLPDGSVRFETPREGIDFEVVLKNVDEKAFRRSHFFSTAGFGVASPLALS